MRFHYQDSLIETFKKLEGGTVQHSKSISTRNSAVSRTACLQKWKQNSIWSTLQGESFMMVLHSSLTYHIWQRLLQLHSTFEAFLLMQGMKGFSYENPGNSLDKTIPKHHMQNNQQQMYISLASQCTMYARLIPVSVQDALCDGDFANPPLQWPAVKWAGLIGIRGSWVAPTRLTLQVMAKPFGLACLLCV